MSEENDRFDQPTSPPAAPGSVVPGAGHWLEPEESDGLTDFEINPVIPRQYWYNLKTGRVEEGPLSSWSNRMGPYDTPEDAFAALERARQRDAEWEAADEEWRGREDD